MTQYFKVGEEVALISKRFPECNGNYYITQNLCTDDRFTCPYTGSVIWPGIVYRLEGLKAISVAGNEIQWADQSSLRKIDKGSTSWDTMMTDLEELMEGIPSNSYGIESGEELCKQ